MKVGLRARARPAIGLRVYRNIEPQAASSEIRVGHNCVADWRRCREGRFYHPGPLPEPQDPRTARGAPPKGGSDDEKEKGRHQGPLLGRGPALNVGRRRDMLQVRWASLILSGLRTQSQSLSVTRCGGTNLSPVAVKSPKLLLAKNWLFPH